MIDENKDILIRGFLFLNITRTSWQTVRRITYEILGVKGLIHCVSEDVCIFNIY